jgi:hypothetical protein
VRYHELSDVSILVVHMFRGFHGRISETLALPGQSEDSIQPIGIGIASG